MGKEIKFIFTCNHPPSVEAIKNSNKILLEIINNKNIQIPNSNS